MSRSLEYLYGKAKYLRENLPLSEIWFMEEWKKAGMLDDNDRSNVVTMGYIPDIVNEKYKYVIEIDGDSHKIKGARRIDNRKDKQYRFGGYKVIRVRYLNYHSFLNAVRIIRKIRKIFDDNEIERKKIKTIIRRKQE